MHNFDFIPTGYRFDKIINRFVWKQRRRFSNWRLKISSSLRKIVFTLLRKPVQIQVFHVLDVAIHPLPIAIYVKIKNGVGFEVNGKSYGYNKNIVFVENYRHTKWLKLTARGYGGNVTQKVSLQYITTDQRNNNLGAEVQFELQPKPDMNRLIGQLSKEIKGHHNVNIQSVDFRVTVRLPAVQFTDTSQHFYTIRNGLQGSETS